MAEANNINERLEQHSRMLQKDSLEYAKLARSAVDARNAYDLKKAQTLLVIRSDSAFAKWTVSEKDAQVLDMCQNEMIAARVAEAHLDAMKMRLRAVEASLSAIQSQARILKMESALDNYRT